MTDYLALSYGLSVTAVILVAIYAFYKGFVLRRKIESTESFLTARNQVSNDSQLICEVLEGFPVVRYRRGIKTSG